MSIVIMPPKMLAYSGMLRIGTNEKAFHASGPSISCIKASLVLCDVYLGSYFKSPFVRNVGYTFKVMLCDFIVSMSCLRSGLFA